MQSTHLSLLAHAVGGSEIAWTKMVELYQPFVYGWLRHHGVDHHDAEELTQDVMSVVVKELPQFKHSGKTGAFRNWIRLVTANRAKGFWRAGKLRAKASGSSGFHRMVSQLQDDTSDLSRRWDEEHDNFILYRLLCELEQKIEPKTLQSFRRQVIDRVPAEKVAEELNMSVAAVYCSKSRVLKMLRQSAEGLVDETSFS